MNFLMLLYSVDCQWRLGKYIVHTLLLFWSINRQQNIEYIHWQSTMYVHCFTTLFFGTSWTNKRCYVVKIINF